MLSAFPPIDEDVLLLAGITPIYLPLCNNHFMRHTNHFTPVPRAADKAEAQADAEDGKKKKGGGIQVPEEWPWEEAKKVFEHPDVTPASNLRWVFGGLRLRLLWFGF
jgi:hypothetical protein